jgi:TonB family protein
VAWETFKRPDESATGLVQNTGLAQSSGHAALDEAAERAAYAFEFQPARNRDNSVPVWLRIPIIFTTR